MAAGPGLVPPWFNGRITLVPPRSVVPVIWLMLRQCNFTKLDRLLGPPLLFVFFSFLSPFVACYRHIARSMLLIAF